MTITINEKDILNEYAELKKEIKALEEKADELNPKVLDIMELNGAEEIAVSDLGKLALGSRRTWKYPDQIKELEAEVKDKKKEAEQVGTATYTEKKYVIFKTSKEEYE